MPVDFSNALDFSAPPSAAPQQGPSISPDTARKMRLQSIARVAAGDPGVTRDALTLGLQKPVSGLSSAVGGEIAELFGYGEPATFGERFQAGTTGYQQALDEAKQKAGTAGTVDGVVGSLASGGPVRGAVARMPTLAGVLTSSGIMGGVEGAARGSDTPEGAVMGGLTGAGVGAATAGVLHGGGRAITSPLQSFRARRADIRGPTPEALRDQARNLYQQLDQSGTAYSAQQARDLGNQIGPALRAENIRVSDMPVAEDLVGHQGPLTLEQLQRYRTQASDLARSSDSRERRMAGVLLRSIDDYVSRENPMQTSLPPGDVDRLWGEARNHWRTAGLTDDLGFAVDKAQRRAASTASGGNVENTIRQNVRGVRDRATKPGAYNPYGPETIADMDRIIEGSWGQNRLREVGNTFGGSGPVGIVPGGVGGMTGLSLGLDPLTAGVIGGGIWGVGRGARLMSRNMTENAAEEMIGNVARGGRPAQTFADQMAGAPTRERLAAMMAASVPRAAGRYAAGQASGGGGW